MFSFSLITKKNLASISIIVVACLLLPACITTSAKSYTDPDYVNYKPKKIVVSSISDDFEFNTKLEKQIIEKISRKGIEGVSYLDIFAPTRTYTSDQVFNKLMDLDITSLLVISPNSDASQSEVAFIQSYSTSTATANAYSTSGGNVYGSAYGTSNTMSVPMKNKTRQFTSEAKLYDSKTQKVAWLIQTKTAAQGWLYVGDGSLISDISSEIVSKLIKDLHLSKSVK